MEPTRSGRTKRWAPRKRRPAQFFLIAMAVMLVTGLTLSGRATPAAATLPAQSWSTQTSALGYSLVDVQFVSATSGWAVGTDEPGAGVIIHTTDSGATWVRQGVSVTTAPLTSVAFYDALHGLAVGDGGLILRTADGGATWTRITSPSVKNLGSVAYSSSTVCWITSNWLYGSGIIMKSTDGGVSWSVVPDWKANPDNPGDPSMVISDVLRGGRIAFADANHGVALGRDGYLSYLNGAWGTNVLYPPVPPQWPDPDSEPYMSLHDVTFVGLQGWLVAEYEDYDDSDVVHTVIYHSDNGGQSWAVIGDTVNGTRPTAVAFASATEGWVVGDDRIIHTTDGGVTWTPQGAQTPFYLQSVSAFGPKACAVGWDGRLFTYGTPTAAPVVPCGFVEVYTETNMPIDAVDFKDANNGCAVSSKGFVFVTADGGTTWAKRTAPTGCFEVAMGDAQHIWIGGSDSSRVFATANAGVTWAQQLTGLSGYEISRLSAADASRAFAVNYAASSAQTTDGVTWRQPPILGNAGGRTGGRFEGVHYLDAQHAYLMGAYFPGSAKSLIFFTQDGGATWTEQLNPGLGKLRATSFVDAQHGWVGGYENATLMKTVDGSSWASVAAPCGEPFPAFMDANNGFVINYFAKGALHQTANAGTSFTSYVYPGLLSGIDAVGQRVCLVGEVPGPDGSIGKIWVHGSAQAAATVGTPVAPATMYRTKGSTVYGTLTPKHTAGTYPVRIYKWHLESGAWKPYGYVNAQASDSSTYSKYSASVSLPSNGSWRLRAYAPADSLHAAVWSIGYDYVTVTDVYTSTPVAPATMYRTRYSTVYGYLKPKHTAGTYPVRIYKYRYVSGTWKSYGYVSAKASNYSSYTKYAASVKLPYAGRWRLRAYASADSLHAAVWSGGYDYVTVR